MEVNQDSIFIRSENISLSEYYHNSIDKIKEKSKYFTLKNFHYISSNRSDAIDYFKKNIKKIDYKIFIADSNEVLKDVYPEEYLPDLNLKLYEIPTSKWSSKFYSRYLQLKDRQSTSTTKDVEHLFTVKIPNENRTSVEEVKKQIEKNYALKTNVPGAFIYTPLYCQLECALKKLYEAKVLENRFYRSKFSPLIAIKDLILNDYLFSCGRQMHYHLKITGNAKKITHKSYLEQNLQPLAIIENTTGVHYAMNYSSCNGLWAGYRNKNFTSENEIIGFYDNSVDSYRDQEGKVQNLERLEIFNRFEYVFLGDCQLVFKEIDRIKQNLSDFLKILNIGHDCEKTFAWYSEDKQSPGYSLDFQFKMPSKELEIGNLSFNSDHWTKPFNIKYNGKPCVSGCSGLGLQRLIYVFLICNGLDIKQWPKELCKYLPLS